MSRAEGSLLLSCEHAGNRVPPAHRALFARKAKLLDSHRGWDPGALAFARRLASRLGCELAATTTTRLLVDANRSAHNPAVFSEISRSLPRELRRQLLSRYHAPHWQRIREAVSGRGRSLHVAVHSFTPRWRGEERRFALGILYDPGRARERDFAVDWQRRLRERLPGLGVRRNAPYRGSSDGLTTALRRELPESRYLGLELELNQGAIRNDATRRALLLAVAQTLRATAARDR